MINSIIQTYYSPVGFKDLNKADKSRPTQKVNTVDHKALYSIYLNKSWKKEITGYVHSLYHHMAHLKDSSSELMGDVEDSVFSLKEIVSSNQEVLEGEFIGNGNIHKADIEIIELAMPQQNRSKPFVRRQFNGFEEGLNSFTIHTDAGDTQIKAFIRFNQTNEQVLKSFSQKINQAQMHIQAHIQTNKDGNICMELTSKHTGNHQRFTIEEQTGNFVSQSGINAITQKCRNAVFKINGEEETSSSNQVSKEEQDIYINLKAPGKASLSVVHDFKEIYHTIETFIQDYNDALQFTGEQDDSQHISGFTHLLHKTIEHEAPHLRQIGIMQQEDGTLAIEQETLTSILQKNISAVKNILGGVRGVAAKIYDIAQDISSEPMVKYMDFRNLKYNYSYNYANILQHKNPFQLIESGLLVDIAI